MQFYFFGWPDFKMLELYFEFTWVLGISSPTQFKSTEVFKDLNPSPTKNLIQEQTSLFTAESYDRHKVY